MAIIWLVVARAFRLIGNTLNSITALSRYITHLARALSPCLHNKYFPPESEYVFSCWKRLRVEYYKVYTSPILREAKQKAFQTFPDATPNSFAFIHLFARSPISVRQIIIVRRTRTHTHTLKKLSRWMTRNQIKIHRFRCVCEFIVWQFVDHWHGHAVCCMGRMEVAGDATNYSSISNDVEYSSGSLCSMQGEVRHRSIFYWNSFAWDGMCGGAQSCRTVGTLLWQR